MAGRNTILRNLSRRLSANNGPHCGAESYSGTPSTRPTTGRRGDAVTTSGQPRPRHCGDWGGGTLGVFLRGRGGVFKGGGGGVLVCF